MTNTEYKVVVTGVAELAGQNPSEKLAELGMADVLAVDKSKRNLPILRQLNLGSIVFARTLRLEGNGGMLCSLLLP